MSVTLPQRESGADELEALIEEARERARRRRRRNGALFVIGVLLAVGGYVLATDTGRTARRAQAPPRVAPAPTAASGSPLGCDARPASLVDLAFPSTADGWVLAGEGPQGLTDRSGVLGTRDGGGRWQCQWRAGIAPLQLTATDSRHAWVLGAQGRYCADPPGACPSVLAGTSDGRHWALLARPVQRITQIAFASPSLGIAAARRAACSEPHGLPPARCAGQVLRSTDGGRDWSVALRTPGPVVAVAADHGTLWAAATSLGVAKRSPTAQQPGLVVFLSRDRGRSWTRGGHVSLWFAGVRQHVQLLPGRDDRLLLSVMDSDGCAMHGCSPDDLYVSRNGGRTWRLADPPYGADGVRAGCGLSGQVVLGQSPDGSEWASEGPPLATCSAPATTLFTTEPGPPAHGSWTVAHRWPLFRPLALARPSASTGYALGPAGVTKTADGGRDWSQVLPNPSPAIALHAVSATVAYGIQDATDQGAITQTIDSGAHWRLSAHVPLNLSLVDFATARDGFAVGASWSTATSTTTWQLYATSRQHPSWALRARLPLRGDQQVSGLWMANAHRGVMLVSHGAIWPQVMTGGIGPLTLWQTQDGARTWTRLRAIPFSAQLTFGSATFAPNRAGGWTGWLLSNHVEATNDTGRHWHSLAPNPTIDGAELLTPRSAIAWHGPDSARVALWSTTDAGHRWHRLRVPQALATGISNRLTVQASFTTPHIGWLIADGTAWRTTDGGRNWHQSGPLGFGG